MSNHVLNQEHIDDKRSQMFDKLMATTYQKVYGMAYRLCGNRADAEDLTQEACFRAYRSFAEYEGSRPFENWIFRIVTRLFLDLLRNRRRRVKILSYDTALPHEFDDGPNFEFPDQRSNPEAQLLEGLLSEDLQNVFSSLSDEDRTLVTLADIDQIPYLEIAEQLGKPVGTIRSRLHRTHRRLRRCLKQARRERLQADSPQRVLRERAASQRSPQFQV